MPPEEWRIQKEPNSTGQFLFKRNFLFLIFCLRWRGMIASPVSLTVVSTCNEVGMCSGLGHLNVPVQACCSVTKSFFRCPNKNLGACGHVIFQALLPLSKILQTPLGRSWFEISPFFRLWSPGKHPLWMLATACTLLGGTAVGLLQKIAKWTVLDLDLRGGGQSIQLLKHPGKSACCISQLSVCHRSQSVCMEVKHPPAKWDWPPGKWKQHLVLIEEILQLLQCWPHWLANT